MEDFADSDEEEQGSEFNAPHEDFAQPPESEDEGLSWGDRTLVAKGDLSPRHKKLAEMAAQGIQQQVIAKELGYSISRVCVLLSNSQIKREVDTVRERIYEDSIGSRLKKMSGAALDEINRCLDPENKRYGEKLKVETSKWLVEKLDGKAAQKIDMGENLLALVMDKLDSLKAAGKVLEGGRVRDVSERIQIEGAPEIIVEEERLPKTEAERLKDWADSF